MEKMLLTVKPAVAAVWVISFPRCLVAEVASANKQRSR